MQTMDTQPGRGAAPAPQQKKPGADAAQGLNPQQLQQMQTMAKQVMGLLLDDAHAKTLVAQCRQGDPAQVAATVTVNALQRSYEAAQQAGQNIDMVVVLVAGMQVLGNIAEILEAAGVLTEQQVPQFFGQACKLAVDMHNGQVQQQGAPA